jgi:hypothetical protein
MRPGIGAKFTALFLRDRIDDSFGLNAAALKHVQIGGRLVCDRAATLAAPLLAQIKLTVFRN